MRFKVFPLILIFTVLTAYLSAQDSTVVFKTNDEVICGAERYDEYEYYLRDEKVALVANQSSVINDTLHLVDFLMDKGLDLLESITFKQFSTLVPSGS